MIHGTLLLVATGLCWVLIAVVISTAARRRLDLDFIQAGAALLTAAAAGGALLFQRNASIPLPLQLAVFGAGVGNYLMIKLMNAGMARGHNGAVWGITQSALVFPFTMGMLFFGVAPTVSRLTGLALILAAIVLFSFSKEKKPGTSGNWLLPTLGAFFCRNLAMLRESALLPRRRRHAEHTPGAAGPARRARLVRRERRVDPEPVESTRHAAAAGHARLRKHRFAVLPFLPRTQYPRVPRLRLDRLPGRHGLLHCRIPDLQPRDPGGKGRFRGGGGIPRGSLRHPRHFAVTAALS